MFFFHKIFFKILVNVSLLYKKKIQKKHQEGFGPYQKTTERQCTWPLLGKFLFMAAGLEAYKILIKFILIHYIKTFYIYMYIHIDIESSFFRKCYQIEYSEMNLKKNKKWKWYIYIYMYRSYFQPGFV